MEHVRIAEKVKFSTWLGGNGECQDLRKSECPHLLGWKWDMSGFHKKSEFPDVFGGKLDMSRFKKK